MSKLQKTVFLFLVLAILTTLIYGISKLYVGDASMVTAILIPASGIGIFLSLAYNAKHHHQLDPNAGVPAVFVRYGKWIGVILIIAALAAASWLFTRYFPVILAGMVDGWLFAYWLAPLLFARD